ncbi:unnamed protein product [Microthlaspi erraticum]|uniref:Uncharacterized protein n=1 Tax=Microthlaspi erraticum TaxID=1685480 RepID=A0A6D2I8V8_9BRAS|nr:unnamed protein product [Microthlaspi erraticum]
MDFIKTTSPRALNWSRRLNRATAFQPRVPADEELSSHDRPTQIVRVPSRLVARPSSRTDPGSIVPRSTRPSLATISRARPHRAEQGGIALCPFRPLATIVLRTITPSDQEGIVPRPGQNLDQNHPSGRTRRPNDESLGHDRPDRTDGRSSPDSRPNVRTVRSTRSPF